MRRSARCFSFDSRSGLLRHTGARAGHGRWIARTIAFVMLIFTALPAVAQERVTLEFWHIWTGHRRTILRQALDRFEERYPHIKVQDSLFTSTERVDKLTVSIGAGMPPDVAMVGFDEAVRWARLGVATPLRQYIQRDYGSLEQIMYPFLADGLLYNGDYYYLPHVMAVDTVLYANADLLEESGLSSTQLPVTTDDLLDAAKKLTRRQGDQLVQIGKDIFKGPVAEWPRLSFARWLHIRGGSLWDASGNPTIDTADALETLEWMREFNDAVVGGMAELKAFYAQNSLNTEINFRNGRQGFMMQNDYVWGLVRGTNPELNMTMAVVPYVTELGPRALVQPGWGYSILSKSHPDESWLLLSWLTMEEEGGLAFAESQGRPTAVPQANVKPSYFDGHPYWHVIIESFLNAVPMNSGPAGFDIQEDLDRMLWDTVYETRVGFGTALSEAQRMIEQKLAEWE